jgi:hypothetical protein
MARRITKAQSGLIAIAIVIGVPIFIVAEASEALGVGATLSIIVGIVAIIVIAVVIAKKRRRAALLSKYGDSQVVERIMSKTIWVGETSDQLHDSLGAPIDVDQHVLKTKRKETWKYVRKGVNRYGLRVVVENGFVVGWDEKV